MNTETRESLRRVGPGRMTASMHAVSVGPRVLRVGVVRNGRIVEERILRARAPVTIGRSESNTFVVAGERAPSTLRIFEYRDDSYFLNVVDGMSGRLATSSGGEDVAALAGGAAGTETGRARARRVRLDEDARGKVVVGDVAVLFQFVTAPPAQPKPELPLSIVRGNGIDWRTTVIAAFSFMAHFAAIGAVYSEWLDAPLDYDIVVSNVIESVPYVPVAENPEVPSDSRSSESGAPHDSGAKGRSGRARDALPGRAGLANAIERMQMNVLGVISGTGATADVLRSGEVPTGLLDVAASRNTGVGSPGLTVAAGGPLKPGALGPGLASVGDTHVGPNGSGTTSAPAGPRGTVTASHPQIAGGAIRNAGAVVASLRAGFRRCYERALAENPDAEGRIDLSLKVGPGGEVTSATAAAQGNLSSTVVACIRARAQTAEFDPPEGGLALVEVPVSLVRQP